MMKVIEHEGDRVKVEFTKEEFELLERIVPEVMHRPDGMEVDARQQLRNHTECCGGCYA